MTDKRDMEPTPQTMRIIRKLILELEVRAEVRFGTETWKIIKEYAREIDGRWQRVIDRMEL